MDAVKMKARITVIGSAYIHEPDRVGSTVTIEGWAIDGEGSDFPGVDYAEGRLGGWMPEELALIADVARLTDHATALMLAEQHRGARDVLLLL